jgi:hypothetical protein
MHWKMCSPKISTSKQRYACYLGHTFSYFLNDFLNKPLSEMKKIFYLLLSGLLLFSSPVLSQGLYEKGDISVNAGISLGLIGYGFGYYGSGGFAVPLTANLEYGLNEMITVGPYVGYLRRNYGDVGSRYSFTSIAFGGQAVFHVTPLLNEHLDLGIDEGKIDYYGKVILGYETYTWRYNGENLNNNYYNNSGRGVLGL